MYTSRKITCFQCRAQGQLNRKFGADHVKILEYGGSCKNSRLYCIHSEQVFERRTNYMIHDDDATCVCRYHTWKEIKNEASFRGYEALDSHKDEDIIRTAERFTLLCKKHNRTFETTYNTFHDKGSGCPQCGTESKGEAFTSSFLDYMNLRYEKQVKFNNCRYKKSLPFDFKVYNSDGTWFLLEFDGIQHFIEVPYWGGKKKFKEAQKRDRIKNRFCNENKIFLIRIQSKKNSFKPSDRERVIKALEKAGNIMAFLSEINRKHSWVISVEI